MANAATVFRDYVTDGVPASGANKTKKSEIRAWGSWVENNLPGYSPDIFPGPTTQAKIEAAAAAAVADGRALHLADGKIYSFTQLSLPDNLRISGNGILRSDGSLTGSAVSVTLGQNTKAPTLTITTPGTETNTDILKVGRGSQIGLLTTKSDVQRAGGGIVVDPQDVQIDYVKTRKIDRPLHLYNTGTVSQTTGTRIGFLDCEDYVRAFRATFTEFSLGGLWAVGRSANASKSAGHNGVLIVGCANWDIGNCWIEDAGEHAFRIGGSDGLWAVTKNYQIGVIFAIRSGGCALKVNPTLLVSPGVTEKAHNGVVTGVVGVDVGDPPDLGNEEVLRLTHVNGLTIGFVHAYTDGDAASGQYLLQINDANGVTIGELGGSAVNSGFISIDGTSDIEPGNQFGGDVLALRIDRLFGICNGTNAIGVNTAFNVGRVHVGLDGIRGQTVNVLRWIAGTLSDVFELTGRVNGLVAPAYQGVPASDLFLVDVSYNNSRSIGRANGSRSGTATIDLLAGIFSAASGDPTGLFLNGSRATAGSGNYGAGIEFSRLGSSRRGAAIVPRQGSTDDKEVGLSFFVGDTNTTGNEALLEAMILHHTGRPAFPMLGLATTYADNAAALAGGLTAGMTYRTATGQIMIVY